MARILVLGGYGGFGGRIARRLAAAGHEVLVAGRSAGRAGAFCGDDPRLKPLAVDRAAMATAIDAHRPAIVVDAAGPFQGMDHRVPAVCIAAGVHYLDIADGRGFVVGIGALDDAARAAGVVAISGASSVPALSGASVRALAEGMDDVRAVEMAISASNRATAGASVATAVLDYVGRPVRLWRGRRWTLATGWQELRRARFAVAGDRPLAARVVALADVPDLALLPDRLPGRPAVHFRAGTELALQNLAVWLASWPVRWGWIDSLRPFARWLLPLQRLTAWAGSDRSAMQVRVFGTAQGQRVERRWTLVASDGDGPEIPALTVPLLVDRVLSGKTASGARDAGNELRLTDYDVVFAGLSIRCDRREFVQPPPLYARVMRDRFDALPPSLRAIHDVLRDGGAAGRAIVTGAANPVAHMIARLMRFPVAGDHDLHVSFAERHGVEAWTRDFGGRCFRSHLSQRGSWLVERFGPLRFAFDLPSDARGLTMVMRAWWFGPLRLPLAFAPRSTAREWEEDGRFHFDVPIALPLIGRLVRYRGWLVPA